MVRDWEVILIPKVYHEGDPCADRAVLYLDRGGGYMNLQV